MGYRTFVRSALRTYVINSESGAHQLRDREEGGGRRRYDTVDRAVAYEKERRETGR